MRIRLDTALNSLSTGDIFKGEGASYPLTLIRFMESNPCCLPDVLP